MLNISFEGSALILRIKFNIPINKIVIEANEIMEYGFNIKFNIRHILMRTVEGCFMIKYFNTPIGDSLL